MHESTVASLRQQLSDISMDMDVMPDLVTSEAKEQVASADDLSKDEPASDQDEDRTPSTEESPKEDEARLAAPVEMKKGFLRSFRKKKTVDFVLVEPNEPNDMDVTPELLTSEAKEQVSSTHDLNTDEPTPVQAEEEGRAPSAEDSPKEDEGIELATPVETKKGFLRFFRKQKKVVDLVPTDPNESNVGLVAPLGVDVPPKEQETVEEEHALSNLAAPIAIKKKKRAIFRSFQRTKSKQASTVEQKRSTNVTSRKETNPIAEIPDEELQKYLAEIGVSPSQAEKERLEKSQEQGSFWAELFHFPLSIFQTIQEDTPQTGDDSDFVFLGFCLTFPQFIGQYIERDVQGLQAVGEGIKAEFNKEEEIAKLQSDLLHLNPTTVDEVNESIEQELEQTETVDNQELELLDTTDKQAQEPTEAMNSGCSNDQGLEQTETVNHQELEQVDTMEEQELEPTETMKSEHKEQECAGEEVELSAAAMTEENEQEKV